MRHTFSWKHAFAMLAIVCLLSIVAGAALAQEPVEPDPEDVAPEVPVFDLSGSAQEPTEPEPEDAVNPLIVIEPMAAPTGLPVINSPADGSVVTTLDPNFEFGDPASGDVIYYLVWELSQGYFDPSGLFVPYAGQTPKISKFVNAAGTEVDSPITGTTSTAGASGYTVFESPLTTVPSGGLTNGLRYILQASFANADGIGPWAQSVFTVDVASVSPASGSTVITTTPLITWPDSGATYYHFLAATPDSNAPDGFSYFSYWLPNFGADICSALPPGPGQPSCSASFKASDICADGQCKARPNVELDYDFFGNYELGTFTVNLYAIANNSATVSFAELNTALSGSPLTSFSIASPGVQADANTGPTEGRPGFTVNRVGQTVDEILPAAVNLLGFTQTVYPDYYQIFIFDDEGFFQDEWFWVSNPADYPSGTNPCVDASSNPAPCTLIAYDGVQEGLYNGDYQYVARGYSSILDGYTPFSDIGSFTINEVAPLAEETVVAGFYELIGPDSDAPQPYGLTSTWLPCDTDGGNPYCESNHPYIHIAVNVGGDSGDWIGIAQIPADYATDETAFDEIYFNYFNVYQPQYPDASGIGEYWQCGQYFGAGAFTSTTCFFRAGILDEDGALDDADGYLLFTGSYGPGGASTGGVGGSGFSVTEFATQAPDPVENIGVDLAGVAPLTFTYLDLPGFTQTLLTGVPKFYWDDQPSAEFYGILVYVPETSANGFYQAGDILAGGDYDDDGEVENFEWVDADSICDGDGHCAYQFAGSNAPFYDNGKYTVYVVYYDGALSEFASLDFTVDEPAAAAPLSNTLDVYVIEGLTGTLLPIFEWGHVQGNDFYNLQVFDSSNTPLLGVDYTGDGAADGLWYAAAQICHIDEVLDENGDPVFVDVDPFETGFPFSTQQLGIFCTVDTYDELLGGNFDVLLSPDTYTFQIDSFGPGSPNIVEGPSETFVIPDIDNVEVVGIYPTNGAALTHTNVPTFYWESAPGVSWYQVFVGHDLSQTLGGSDYLPMIFTYVYRPYAANDAEIDDFFDNGIIPCYAQNGIWVDDEYRAFDSPKDVCSLSYSPYASGSPFNYYDTPFYFDGEFEWYIEPLESDFSGGYDGLGTFTVDLGPGDPVIHSLDCGFFCFNPGIRGVGDFYNTLLDGSLFDSLRAIDWYPPQSDYARTETLAYVVDITDVASGADLDVPVELDIDGDGVTETLMLNSDLGGVILPEWVNCDAQGNFYCRLPVSVEYFTAYGVYEVKIGVVSQGGLNWNGPEPIISSFTGFLYPPTDGSFGKTSAKFTKL